MKIIISIIICFVCFAPTLMAESFYEENRKFELNNLDKDLLINKNNQLSLNQHNKYDLFHKYNTGYRSYTERNYLDGVREHITPISPYSTGKSQYSNDRFSSLDNNTLFCHTYGKNIDNQSNKHVQTGNSLYNKYKRSNSSTIKPYSIIPDEEEDDWDIPGGTKDPIHTYNDASIHDAGYFMLLLTLFYVFRKTIKLKSRK